MPRPRFFLQNLDNGRVLSLKFTKLKKNPFSADYHLLVLFAASLRP